MIKKYILRLIHKFYDSKTTHLLDFIKWKIWDIYHFRKYGKPVHLFGIKCICGMYGQGKTVALTNLAINYRNKYKDKIYISSNYGLGIQDFPIKSVKDITKHYDKPIIFLWDEVQNDFPATDKVFPKEIREALTLNRKGNGKMIYWCSQDHELVHKTIRRLTIEYGKVRTLFSRYTKIRWFLKEDYEMLIDEIDVDKKRKIKPIRIESFIQSNYIRSLYNSYGIDNGECITGEQENKQLIDISDFYQ